MPTVRGTPDHGAAWSRPWQRVGADEVAECDGFTVVELASSMLGLVREIEGSLLE